jgi:hypothetical protein
MSPKRTTSLDDKLTMPNAPVVRTTKGAMMDLAMQFPGHSLASHGFQNWMLLMSNLHSDKEIGLSGIMLIIGWGYRIG